MQHETDTPTTSAATDDYDSPWKDMLEHAFPEFMAYYFPDLYAQIDWSQGFEFKNTELRQVVRDAELGKRFADCLVRVTLKSGGERWIYTHVEVQGQRDGSLPKRVFTYNYRIYDRFDCPVASLVILADESPNWRPSEFGFEALGCQVGIRFPVAKLMDYAGREAELQEDPNPFALVTLAHLQTQATRHNPQARFDAKWKLVQLLYRRGWDKQRIIDLFFVIDWMMHLPDFLSRQLWQNVETMEQEQRMAYVSSVERIGIEKGRQLGWQEGQQEGVQQGIQQGMQQGVQQGEALALQKLLVRRFGALPASAVERIANARAELLEVWLDRVLDAATLEEVFFDARH
ncbi:MAG: cytosolic protein [Rhodoferax sp.]|nr:cytosolic protein [Rhodoferax sp.]